MKKILSKINISIYTYIFFIISFLCGYFKNILIIFSICIVHELGHVLFIILFKYKISSINIYPFGGYTIIDKRINTSINKDILISLGGIIFQIILYILLIFFNNIKDLNIINTYNTYILVFNILPIIPLDGSKLLNLLLEKILSYKLSYILNTILSIIFLIIFIVINYIYKINNYFIIIFLIYHLVLNIKIFKTLYNRFLLERYIGINKYNKIDSNTKNIKDIRKEVLHYFKDRDRYINEREYIYLYHYIK